MRIISPRIARYSILAVVAIAAAIALSLARGEESRPVGPIESIIEKLRPLHQTKTAATGTDWLVNHPEDGQTFKQYVKSDPNRPTKKRTTIYIQPWGDFDATQRKLIDDTDAYMQVFFGLPVKRLDPIKLETIPNEARRVHPTWGVKQVLTGYVLKSMQAKRPDDAVAVIALTTSDLWPGENWNFVFGEASLTERVGVWSLARFGDPAKDYTTVLRRTLQTAAHETGHMLGIQHCIAYECCMNGSNNMAESDRAPLAFCAECDAKILWACGGEARKRFDALAQFARDHRLKDGAAFWEKEAGALGK